MDGGPPQIARIQLRPSVNLTDARNTENQIAVGLSGRKALGARGLGRSTP